MKNIDRAKTIVRMKKKGCTFQEIGDKFGISRQRAHKIYSTYLKQNTPGTLIQLIRKFDLFDRIINWYWKKRIIEPEARD